MKKLSLLLLCALSALAGAAQTGVGVSNFQATQGSATTATFTVSWTPNSGTGRDSVWVFVDYNIRGTMERLPLNSGSLTNPSQDGASIKVAGNAAGAWVIAPAGGEAFSATVTLLSSTTYSYGSCAYAIPQPPEAHYTAYNAVKFTGTPPFELTFAGGGGSVSVPATTYTFPAGKTLTAFTDATRAPGIFTCTMPIVNPTSRNRIICNNTTAQLNVSASSATTNTYQWQWYKNGEAVTEGSGGTTNSYTTGALTNGATYSVATSIGACSVTNTIVVSMSTVTQCCNNDGVTYTKPESTVNFTAFSPCSATEVGTVWYLTDTRTYGNNQTYKVKKMPDGTIWMVQDMMFGNCSETSWVQESNYPGQAATTITPTVAPGYVGHCWTKAPSITKFAYTWGGAMNCSAPPINGDQCACGTSTASSTCGICPVGWHIPSGYVDGELYVFLDLLRTREGCDPATTVPCLAEFAWWEPEWGCFGDPLSNCYSSTFMYAMWTRSYKTYTWRSVLRAWVEGNRTSNNGIWDTYSAAAVRCVRNY
jgi:hypothetical protein